MAIFLCLASVPKVSFGQLERYELGNRLRRFEVAWEDADESIRSRSTPVMERAVSAFFSLRFRDAARRLDEAWLVTQTTHRPNQETRWLVSHRIDCEHRLHDASKKSLDIGLTPLYEIEIESSPDPEILIRLATLDGRSVAEQMVTWETMINGYTFKHDAIESGDYQLSLTATGAQLPALEIGSLTVSFCDRVQDRIREAEAAVRTLGESGTPTGTATALAICAQLESLLEGQIPESDIPADRRLQFLEDLIAKRCRSQESLNIERPGDYFVELELDGASVPTRLRIPENVDGKLPVVIAFHGAGGSENMFFETYGAGRLVDLAAERGWLVVSPRQALFGLRLNVAEILTVLTDHFEIDQDRIFLVGHSMGAGQVVTQCEGHGELIAKAVAIGGGRAPRDIESLRHPKWFISAGERDFGRRGAAALARRLRESEVPVTYFEAPNVEHMVIVQASLDEVFEFLDD